MIILSFIFITIITKTKLELSITTTIISFGISYTFYIITSILMAAILSLTKLYELSCGLSILFISVQSLLQLSLITVPFKIKRLKSGMPFLINKGFSNACVLFSVILLFAAIVFNNNKAQLIYIIPIFLVLLCAILVLFWWRKKITQTYLERLKAEEIQDLHNSIDDKDNRIKYLEQQNEILSKIIHKDNKLIPAMELVVREYANNPLQNEEDGEKLIEEISKISKERCGIIEKYKNSGKKLSLTNVFSIDTMFNYMLNKAISYNIDFDVGLSGSVQFMIENVIHESDLNTLLADLIENAIIATKVVTTKKVIVNIGILDGCYFIDVIDSGTPFGIETLNSLGIKKVTTHKDEGGSGIGMLNTFDLAKKANASIIIKEYTPNDKFSFTKKVSIRFDEKHQYIIESPRNEEIIPLCNRCDIIFQAVTT